MTPRTTRVTDAIQEAGSAFMAWHACHSGEFPDAEERERLALLALEQLTHSIQIATLIAPGDLLMAEERDVIDRSWKIIRENECDELVRRALGEFALKMLERGPGPDSSSGNSGDAG